MKNIKLFEDWSKLSSDELERLPKKDDKVKILIGRYNFPSYYGVVTDVTKIAQNEFDVELNIFSAVGELISVDVVPFDYVTKLDPAELEQIGLVTESASEPMDENHAIWEEVEQIIMGNKSTHIDYSYGAESPYATIENISDMNQIYKELSAKFDIRRKGVNEKWFGKDKKKDKIKIKYGDKKLNLNVSRVEKYSGRLEFFIVDDKDNHSIKSVSLFDKRQNDDRGKVYFTNSSNAQECTVLNAEELKKKHLKD